MSTLEYLSGKKLPIAKQVYDYLEYCEYNRRFTAATMKSKRQLLNKFLRDNPHITDLTRLTNSDIDDWVVKLSQSGCRSGKSINARIDHIKGCLKFLETRQNKHLSIRLDAIERVIEEEMDMPYFTPAQVKQIKEKCQGLRDLLLVSLIFDTALRISEISGLKLENIEGYQIRIRGKNRKLRTTFMLPETKELLVKWLTLASISEGYVFPSFVKFDEHMHTQSIRLAITAPIRAAGFEIGGAHAIRRSAITAALNGGLKLQDTAKWAGHADPKITLKHYYKVEANELERRHRVALLHALA